MKWNMTVQPAQSTKEGIFGFGTHILTVLLIAITVLAATLSVTASASSRPSVTPANMDGIGGDFTLHSADGAVALHDFRGKVVLLYFGYTHCPDACPTTSKYSIVAWVNFFGTNISLRRSTR